MNLYAFELGRKKELCFAELISALGKENHVEQNLDTAIFKLDLKDPQKLQDKLGGTIKIIQIIGQYSEELLEKFLKKEFSSRSGKIPFSLSTLNFKNRPPINTKKTLNFSKKILKSLGLNSRFVNKGYSSPKPSTIYKAKVLEKGIDLNILKSNSGLLLGKTVAIQDIDAYSDRDYGKPARDARAGMLPPKLAQIMINLACPAKAAAGPTKTIYDPFCGTGTILMEAILQNKTAIGSDIEPKMIDHTNTNCGWLKEKYSLTTPFHTFQKDACLITPEDLPSPPDAIVTETYLGPPLNNPPSPHQREKIFRNLETLHLNWLSRVTAPIVVAAITAYRDNGEIIPLPNLPELAKEAGFEITQAYIYDRPDQVVAREIVVLEKL